MTKKSIINTETSTAPRRKFRKLTKAEEEEYTRGFNEFLQKVGQAVQEGQIELPERGRKQ